MSFNFDPIRDTEREILDHPTGLKIFRVRRTYDAPPEEIWSALTRAELIERWFLPVDGDLREGGWFSFEGNASGSVLRCDRPRELRVTWEFGGGTSDLKVVLLPDADRTVLELEHAPVPPDIVTNVGEKWGLGAGWELGLTSLGDYVEGNLGEGRAVDRIAAASAEEQGVWAALANRVSAEWQKVLEDADA